MAWCPPSPLCLHASQVPCAFAGGVVTRVDSYRASGGGWVRLVFKNVNGVPLEKVELAKVSSLSSRTVLC
jgi:hypothetical protein